MTRLAVSVAEAAQMLSISKATGYRLATSGRLPVVRLGGRVVVPVAAIHALLEESVIDQGEEVEIRREHRRSQDSGRVRGLRAVRPLESGADAGRSAVSPRRSAKAKSAGLGRGGQSSGSQGARR